MLDIKFIRENSDKIKEAVKNKGIALDVDRLLAVDKERVKLSQEIEELNSLKNDINDLIGKAPSDEERKELIAKGKEIKEKLIKIEPEYKKSKQEFDELMVKVPTIPSPDTPVSAGEEGNLEVLQWGTIPKFDFTPKTHIELGKDLDILDLETGAKVAGYRGYYLKNEGVSLVLALEMYALSKMASKGFSPMIPPTLIKGFPLFGSGYFKGLEYNPETDEMYQVCSPDKDAEGKISKEQKFLVGTAEQALLAYFSDQVLKEEDLPIKVCGFSQCYRSEIGSYGKDTKGHYRVHEFMKVEQVVVSKADVAESDQLHQEMLNITREMHEELGLPYRVLQISTGDMSAGKYKAFDIEAWLPGMNRWAETGSASNFLDWQARRLNIRYVDKNGNKKYCYLLNNTAMPTPRPFIAILENFQQADGSIKVPEVLQKFMPVPCEVIKRK